MCWILGYFWNKKINNFENILLELDSRWPDSHWVFFDDNLYLWHTRLSIIDTSSWANQPFIFNDYVLIFNWEIYNFKEIKTELLEKWFIFKTTSDTEVLLYSYINRGEECVKKLDWMWSFCIYDKINNKLFLSRDRIGEKPLVYYNDNEKFIFSSEMNPVLKFFEKWEIKINNLALSNFDVYNFRHIPSPYTSFENIFKLEPGYNLVYDLNTKSLNKYKYFEVQKIDISSDYVNQFNNLFIKSVENTCFADVPIWIFLSWWIDSSLISSVLKNRNITTYSLWYDENDEEIIRADKIAKHLSLKNKKIFFKDYLKSVNLFDVIKKVILHYGEPINLIQIIYADIILKEMKKDGIKVAIWWNWADEMFYGYNWMNNLYFISDFKKILDKLYIWKVIDNKIVKNIFYKKYLMNSTFIKKEYRKFIYENQLIEYAKEPISKDAIDIFSWLWLRIENEHSITIINDIVWSINWMELRTPFLNKDIIDFSCNLSNKEKIKSYKDNSLNKYILKKTLEKYLPKDLIYQKKMGFWYWINYYELLLSDKNNVDYYIYNISKKIEIFDNEKVLNIYKLYLWWEKKYSWDLVKIIITSIWYEEFIDKK